jgi:hypothetical protein
MSPKINHFNKYGVGSNDTYLNNLMKDSELHILTYNMKTLKFYLVNKASHGRILPLRLLFFSSSDKFPLTSRTNVFPRVLR